MPTFIRSPQTVPAHGDLPKTIEEFFGRANTGDERVSIARMVSPAGWSEPGQTPEFAEFSVVLNGILHVESRNETIRVAAGQAVYTAPGEWVRYSTPDAGGAEYIAVCVPAFSPESVHRDA